MKILNGHVTSRRFNDYALPVPIQNKLLKYYAESKNMLYKLPQCELFFQDNFMAMIDTFKNLDDKEHLGLCSIYMFPESKEKIDLINSLILEKDLTCHLIFEEKEIKSHFFMEFYEEKTFIKKFNQSNKNFFKEIYLVE